jgi:RNA polymerase sigma factor (TIGR02999 family)
MTSVPNDVTRLLIKWSAGDKSALDELVPVVYGELRRLARRHMNRENPGHTLQTSALINEAYLRLVNQRDVEWKDRAHFFAVAAQVMRHILIDHARGQRSAKRGAGAVRVELNEALVLPEPRAHELIELDDALTDLASVDPRRSQIVELRFFGGLSVEETAEVMHLSPATIHREWQAARAWLRRAISARESAGESLSD